MVVKDEQVLMAAIKIFAKEGYEGATTKEIATEAGVNEVTLFRKFHSKENILEAVISQQRDMALKTLASVFPSYKNDDRSNLMTLDMAATLVELGARLAGFMKSRMELMILLISEGKKKPFVATTISDIPQDMIKNLEKIFEEQIRLGKMKKEVDPQLAAVIFLGFIFYYSLTKEIFRDQVIKDNKKTLDAFVRIFLNGVATS
jgi:AcrR family transcriptional regulator